MAQVELVSVGKRYGSVEVVHDVDLEIKDDEFIVLVGPSGCGKSTILRMIAGLESISDGEIKIGGRVVNDVPPKQRDVAMVFQNYALYPHMTVRENMGFSLKMQKRSKDEIERKVNKAAEVLELTALLDRKPAALSGGQRQRVAMGRAIVRQPEVFLFDEPLSNLDAQLRTQMRMELKKLHMKLATTTIYVTHDQVEAMTLADRIVILSDGVVQQVGSPVEVFENPANAFVGQFIGNPPMNVLEGTFSGDQVTAEGFTLPLPKGKWKIPNGSPVLIGIRPDAIKMGAALERVDEAWRAQGQVQLAEIVGSQSILELAVGGNTLIAEVEGRVAARAKDWLPLGFEADRVVLFDPETTRSLA